MKYVLQENPISVFQNFAFNLMCYQFLHFLQFTVVCRFKHTHSFLKLKKLVWLIIPAALWKWNAFKLFTVFVADNAKRYILRKVSSWGCVESIDKLSGNQTIGQLVCSHLANTAGWPKHLDGIASVNLQQLQWFCSISRVGFSDTFLSTRIA